MKFKIGDKVKCVEGMCEGITGTISKIEDSTNNYCDNWSDGKYGYLESSDLKLIDPKDDNERE